MKIQVKIEIKNGIKMRGNLGVIFWVNSAVLHFD